MPKKPKSKGEPQTGSQTVHLTTGFTKDGAAVLAKRLPATYDTYRRIRRNPTVALARALTMAPIIAGEWSVEADDEVDEARIRFIQDQLLGIREVILTLAMSHRVDYGWLPLEKVFEVKRWEGKQRIMLKRLKPLLVDITDILIDGDTGEFAGFRQPPQGNQTAYVNLGVEDSLLITFDVEGSNWHGQPLLENIRRTYLNWEDANAGAERYDKKIAGAQWVVHYPAKSSSKLEGVETDNLTIAKGIVNALEASGSVCVPRKVTGQLKSLNEQALGDGWEIKLIEHAPKQASFVDRMNYCDKQFVRGLLSPERSVLEGQFGTKAEAGVHVGLAMTQRDLEHRHVTRLLNWHVVDQILALNFGDDARGTVRLVAAPLADAKLAFFQEMYKLVLQHPVASLEAIDGLDIDGLMDTVGAPKAAEVVDEDSPALKPVTSMDLRNELAASIRALYVAANGGNGDSHGGDSASSAPGGSRVLVGA